MIKGNKINSDTATIGVDFYMTNFTLSNNYKIKLKFYDSNGGEQYQGIVENLIKKIDAIIMCYDITNYNSFLNMKNNWYERIIKPKDKQNIPLGIIGNKCDLVKDKKVDDEEAIKFAKEINASFSLVSFKSYKETENLINDICLKLIGKDIIDIGDKNYKITEMEVYKVNLIK